MAVRRLNRHLESAEKDVRHYRRVLAAGAFNPPMTERQLAAALADVEQCKAELRALVARTEGEADDG